VALLTKALADLIKLDGLIDQTTNQFDYVVFQNLIYLDVQFD
jgi:hypothetical protein